MNAPTGAFILMMANPKRISKEGLTGAMRRRPAASGGGMALASADQAQTFACAVIVPKKVAALATVRNRLRRRVREALRRISAGALLPFRCVVVVRTASIAQGK